MQSSLLSMLLQITAYKASKQSCTSCKAKEWQQLSVLLQLMQQMQQDISLAAAAAAAAALAAGHHTATSLQQPRSIPLVHVCVLHMTTTLLPLPLWYHRCLLQMHNIEDVAWVSIFGTVGMLLAMVVVVGKLIAIYAMSPPAAPTELVATGQGLNVGRMGRMGRTGV
jgi:hypothetical protein